MVLLLAWLCTAWASPMQLAHQGRVLDAAGEAVQGPHTLVVALQDSLGEPVFTQTFTDHVLNDGYYSVILDNGTPGLDTDMLAQSPLYVQVSVGGALVGERQLLVNVPLAGRAQTAAIADLAIRIPVEGGTTDTLCTDSGVIVYDTTLGALRICASGSWDTIGVKTIVQAGTTRRWSDGSNSTSCSAYLNPAQGFIYNGAIGDGVYEIDVDEDGPLAPVDVECDMTGGGWSVFHHDNESEFRSIGCESPECHSYLFSYDASLAIVSRAIADSSEAAQFISKRCRGSLLYNTSIYGQFYNPSGAVHPSNWPDVGLCNLNDDVWRTSAGDITTASMLPIVRITNGDTGDPSEDSYFQLGPVRVK